MSKSARKSSAARPSKQRNPFKPAAKQGNPFKPATKAATAKELEAHVIRKGVRCDTESRGHKTPRGRSRLEIVVDASEGFIPLWAKEATLRWTFRDTSFEQFDNPAAAKAAVEQLFGEAIVAWGDAAPVKFAKRSDSWDFEIIVQPSDNCTPTGCVLASAFFPDAGRHQLLVYPRMFEQSRKEQVETMVHEIGHIFGLRHFFALVREEAWPAKVFGKHSKFSIMNYGEDSRLTPADRRDLKRLYRMAWSGQLAHINGTPIRFVKPFHDSGAMTEVPLAIAATRALVAPLP